MAVAPAMRGTAVAQIGIRQLQQMQRALTNAEPGAGEGQHWTRGIKLQPQEVVIEGQGASGVGQEETDVMDVVNAKHGVECMEPLQALTYNALLLRRFHP